MPTLPPRRSGTRRRRARWRWRWTIERATSQSQGQKALYGHPLGASSAIEAAICAMAIRDGWVPGTANLETPDPAVIAELPGLLAEGRSGRYDRILSTSFGFGGLNAALVFGSIR
jgi:3-oxoacyl-[acyl-carrier-protein] synthase II